MHGNVFLMYCRLSSSVEDSISGGRIINFTCLVILPARYGFDIPRLIAGVLFRRWCMVRKKHLPDHRLSCHSHCRSHRLPRTGWVLPVRCGFVLLLLSILLICFWFPCDIFLSILFLILHLFYRFTIDYNTRVFFSPQKKHPVLNTFYIKSECFLILFFKYLVQYFPNIRPTQIDFSLISVGAAASFKLMHA